MNNITWAPSPSACTPGHARCELDSTPSVATIPHALCLRTIDKKAVLPCGLQDCACDSQASESQKQNDRHQLVPADRLKSHGWSPAVRKFGVFKDLFEKDIRRLVDISDSMQMKQFLFLFSVWFNSYFHLIWSSSMQIWPYEGFPKNSPNSRSEGG